MFQKALKRAFSHVFIFYHCLKFFSLENVGAVAVGHNQPVARPRDAGPPGARRRRNRRLVARHNDDEDNSGLNFLNVA